MNILSSYRRDVDKDLEIIFNLKNLINEFFIENDFDCKDIYDNIDIFKKEQLGRFGVVYTNKDDNYNLKIINSEEYNFKLTENLEKFLEGIPNEVFISINPVDNVHILNIPRSEKIEIFKKYVLNFLNNNLINDETVDLYNLGLINYMIMLMLSKYYRNGECINFLDIYGFKKCFYDIVLDIDYKTVKYILNDIMIFEKPDNILSGYLKNSVNNFNSDEMTSQKLTQIIESIFIQIIFSIIFYKERFGITNNHLRINNIFIKFEKYYNNYDLDDYDYYYYIINDKKYSFRKTDVIIKINTFGIDKIDKPFEYESENYFLNNLLGKIFRLKYINTDIIDYIVFLYSFMFEYIYLNNYILNNIDMIYESKTPNKSIFFDYNKIVDPIYYILSEVTKNYFSNVFSDPIYYYNYLKEIVYRISEKEIIPSEISNFQRIFGETIDNLTMIDILDTLYDKFDYGYDPYPYEKGVCLGII